MFRLIGILVFVVIGTGGVLAVDFNKAQRTAAEAEGKPLAFTAYVQGLSSRLAGLTGGAGPAQGLPRQLEAMLPRPPEGWTMRPATEDDAAGFLPRGSRDAPKEALEQIAGVVRSAGGRGVDSVSMAFERGDRLVILQLVRHPDTTFTDPEAFDQRVALQSAAPRFASTPFMTVRGLDVVEDLLPDNLRARYFMAQVGGQIHLRVLAPERMRDRDLMPFFETLHVAAMNASVVDRQPGLGEVPVLVLASALEGESRAAYDADLASRRAALVERSATDRAAAEARLAVAAATAEVAEPAGGGFLGGLFGSDAEETPPETVDKAPEISCETGVGGTRRCAVAPAAD